MRFLTIFFLSIFTALVFNSHSYALDNLSIKIDKLPKSIDEFVDMRNTTAKSPEGGATMYLIAMITFTKNKNLGMKFFTISLARGNLVKGNTYKGYTPSRSIMYHINRLGNRPHLPFAYIKGASPVNAYAVKLPYIIEFSRNKYSGDESKGKVKVFIDVYGVSPRPITLKRNNRGIWKVHESSSLSVDVQAPAKNYDDDL